MVGRSFLPGFDDLVVPAYFDTGDAAALEQWKREHPDWFVAGEWTPDRRAVSDGGMIGNRFGDTVVPSGRGPGEGRQVWDHDQTAALDPESLSLADFRAVAAAARQGASQAVAVAAAPPPAQEPEHNRVWWWLHDLGVAQTRHEKAEALRRSMGSASGTVFLRDDQPIDVDSMSDDEILALDKEFRGVNPTPPPAGVVAPTMTSWGWKNGPPYKDAIKEIGKPGTHETINGRVPTEEEAKRMIEESKGVIDRIEDGHPPGFNSPHSKCPSKIILSSGSRL